jgi:hypothetical protein
MGDLSAGVSAHRGGRGQDERLTSSLFPLRRAGREGRPAGAGNRFGRLARRSAGEPALKANGRGPVESALMLGRRSRSLVAMKLRGGIPRVSPAFAPALVFNGGSDMPHAHLEREGVIVVHPA